MTLNKYWAQCGTSWPDFVLAQTITYRLWTDCWKFRDATGSQTCRLEAIFQVHKSTVVVLSKWRHKMTHWTWSIQVCLDCWNRLHNDCMVFQWTPKCLATVFCAIPVWTILKTRLRWFSLSHGMKEEWILSKLKCFSWRIEFKQTFYTSHLNLYRPVNLVLMNISKNDMYSLTMKSPCIWVGNYPILSKNITFIDCVHRINVNNKYRKLY